MSNTIFYKYYKCKGIKMTLKHNYSKEISEFIKANNKRLNLNWGTITDLNQLGQGGSGLVYSGKYKDFDVVINIMSFGTSIWDRNNLISGIVN